MGARPSLIDEMARAGAKGHAGMGAQTESRSVLEADNIRSSGPGCDCRAGSVRIEWGGRDSPGEMQQARRNGERRGQQQTGRGRIVRSGSHKHTAPPTDRRYVAFSSSLSSWSSPFSALPFDGGRLCFSSTDWPSRAWSFAFQSPAPLRSRRKTVLPSVRCRRRFGRSGWGRHSTSSMVSTSTVRS